MKSVKMAELIKHVSEMYRDENKVLQDLMIESYDVKQAFLNTEMDDGKNITFFGYNKLLKRKEELSTEIKLKESYCQGIHDVREFLIGCGFDTNIEW